MSTFSPVSLLSNGMRVCVCVCEGVCVCVCVCACARTEWTWNVHNIGISTYQFIQYNASAINKHTYTCNQQHSVPCHASSGSCGSQWSWASGSSAAGWGSGRIHWTPASGRAACGRWRSPPCHLYPWTCRRHSVVVGCAARWCWGGGGGGRGSGNAAALLSGWRTCGWPPTASLCNKMSSRVREFLDYSVSEVLRSLRHYLWAQSQGHHTIDRLEEIGM